MNDTKNNTAQDETMCSPDPEPNNDSPTNSSTTPTTKQPLKSALKKDEFGYVVHDKNKADLDAAATTWCCGLLGMTPPKSGRELGVWEQSLEDRSNWISWFLLSYLNPMLKLGSSKVLEADDIGVPSVQDQAHTAYERVKVCWEQQLRKTQAAQAYRQATLERQLSKCKTEEEKQTLLKKHKEMPELEPSLAVALFRGFGAWKLLSGIFIYFLSQLLTFVPVLILEDLVRYFQSNGEHDTYIPPWGEVVGLALVPFLVSVMQTRYQVLVAHAGVFVRAAVSLLLYHKSLKVSAAGRAKTSTGQVVNIMSNDTQQLQRLLLFAGMTLVAPIQIIIALALIYQQVRKNTNGGTGGRRHIA
jgi:hypothetical protein